MSFFNTRKGNTVLSYVGGQLSFHAFRSKDLFALSIQMNSTSGKSGTKNKVLPNFIKTLYESSLDFQYLQKKNMYSTLFCEISRIMFIIWLFQILWKIILENGTYVNSTLCFLCVC